MCIPSAPGKKINESVHLNPAKKYTLFFLASTEILTLAAHQKAYFLLDLGEFFSPVILT